ncbi:MAG: hypothetical protein Phyf2KO_03750 [Phycisphaerales bacterium]
MPNASQSHAEAADLRFRPRRRVYLIDRVAEGVITLGGMGVIAAVLGIIAYLLWVVVPLMKPGNVEGAGTVPAPSSATYITLDEYQRLALLLDENGSLHALSLVDGSPVGEPLEFGTYTASSFSPDTGVLALGHEDGNVTLATLDYNIEIDSTRSVSPEIADLAIGESVADGSGVVERTDEDQFRTVLANVSISDQIADQTESATPVVIDADMFGRNSVVAVVRDDGSGSVLKVTTRRSLVGNSSNTSIETLPIEIANSSQQPSWVLLLDEGREVLFLSEDGGTQRYSVSKDAYTLTESVSATDEGESITQIQPLLGRGTVLIGTDRGRVHTLMLTRPNDDGDGGRKLVRVRTFKVGESPIEAMAISRRDRTFAAVDSVGEIRLWHATSGKQIGSALMPGGAASVITIAPKLDGFYAVNETGIASWNLVPGHPKATFDSLFLPVWYEGDQAPSLVYQSTSADDSAESKMSLTPLIFGTFKATVFAMLFAVPVAVMAAIYASEFMSKSLRNKIKPTIEMMASLPSVVLGFIAAMILAPYIRDHLSSVLVGLVVVPISILVGSALWPLLGNRAWRLPQTVQLSVIVIAGLVGIALSSAAGPVIDRALFSLHETEEQLLTGFVDPAQEIPDWAEGKAVFTLGERTRLRSAGLYVLDDRVVEPIEMTDPAIREQFEERRDAVLGGSSPFKLWLTGMIGSPVTGWVALMFVPALIVAGFVGNSFGRAHSAVWIPLVRVIGSVLLAVPIAYLLAYLLSAIGFDPRETILGTFTQRNTFVVGIIMGFAVIPIIFTISDDALQSVPNTLRSASLGAGATQWQTAVRVVLPVATSGIFSAIMIGLGRAAGETMIVLMATGNTPVMDWNIFGGLRTLSANIAVELPEADRGGTHYRVLFLCGVVLFVITFVVNTTAEIVRQHFRKRSAML